MSWKGKRMNNCRHQTDRPSCLSVVWDVWFLWMFSFSGLFNYSSLCLKYVMLCRSTESLPLNRKRKLVLPVYMLSLPSANMFFSARFVVISQDIYILDEKMASEMVRETYMCDSIYSISWIYKTLQDDGRCVGGEGREEQLRVFGKGEEEKEGKDVQKRREEWKNVGPKVAICTSKLAVKDTVYSHRFHTCNRTTI